MEEKKIRIGFDIDGVLCDFTIEFLTRLRDKLNQDINMHPTEYHYIGEHMGFFGEEISRGLFADCMPYPEAEIFMGKLLRDPRFEVHMITARGTEREIEWTSERRHRLNSDTRRWLNHYFPLFDQKNLYYSSSKDLKVRELGLKMFVEDRKDTAERLAKVTNSFLITRSWNHGELDQDVRRIGSLFDLEHYLEGPLLKGK